ncbi:MAG: class C sortase [Ruminiclostridium sp.]|nr:class C sortase [Ruminiclostridium sp.]
MKKKANRSTLILILVFLAGLSLLLYPSVSNWWNESRATEAIVGYTEKIKKMDLAEYQAMWQEAVDYNASLVSRGQGQIMSEEETMRYNRVLDVTGTGIMAYIEIPSIDVELPIHHGTEEAVLQVAVGHLDWTSFPVGGPGTHCVLSAHRGLPSATLFTHLDRLEEGDLFMLHVLDETLTYQVDQILTVEPQEIQELYIQEGQDLCTLVTCTPYGINTHRLLVRGHHIENLPDDYVHVTAEAIPVDPLLVAPLVAAPILVALVAIVLVKTRKK